MAELTIIETDDSCKDLKTIQYKTQLLKGERKLAKSSKTNSSMIEAILDQERTMTRTVAWARLERSACISKLCNFAIMFGEDNEMTREEIASLVEYLQNAYDRKRLTRARDVLFNKETQNIINIPCLTFNKSSRKFTLSRSDRRTSSSASLGPGRDTRRKKNHRQLKKNEKLDGINTSLE